MGGPPKLYRVIIRCAIVETPSRGGLCGIIWGSVIRVMKGDTRSSDSSSKTYRGLMEKDNYLRPGQPPRSRSHEAQEVLNPAPVGGVPKLGTL